MLGRGAVAAGTAGRSGGAPATPPRNRLPHPAAARSQRDWRDHVPALAQQHALAGAAACLLLGASATAATAATFPPGAAPLERLAGSSGTAATVPLRRSIVEDMLLQRLTDRLHSLSDSQLAELLEQLLQDDTARFPAELLQPQPLQQARQRREPQATSQPAMPPEQPQVQLPQRVAPPQPQPDSALSGQPSSPAKLAETQRVDGVPSGSGDAITSSSSSSSTRGSVAGEADVEADSTPDLLQQLQQRFDPGSGGSGAGSDTVTGLALPDWLEASGGLRLVALAFVVPSLLIFVLGKLLTGGSSKAKQSEQQAEQQPDLAPQSPPPEKEQPGFMQMAAHLFSRGKEGGSPAADAAAAASAAGDAAAAGSAAPAAAAASGAAEAGRQPVALTPSSQLPPPPLPPPYAALQAGNGSTAAATAAAAASGAPPPLGPVLWQRREPSASSNGGGGREAAAGDGVLWRRPETAESTLQRQLQQAGAPGLASGGSSSSSSSSSSPVDLWRLPLEQLRSGGSAAMAESAAGAAGSNDGPGAQAPQVEATPRASDATANVNPAAVPPPLGRRLSSSGPQAALDNAEPAGRLARLQRLRGGEARPLRDEEA